MGEECPICFKTFKRLTSHMKKTHEQQMCISRLDTIQNKPNLNNNTITKEVTKTSIPNEDNTHHDFMKQITELSEKLIEFKEYIVELKTNVDSIHKKRYQTTYEVETQCDLSKTLSAKNHLQQDVNFNYNLSKVTESMQSNESTADRREITELHIIIKELKTSIEVIEAENMYLKMN